MTTLKKIDDSNIIFNENLKNFVSNFKMSNIELINQLHRDTSIDRFMVINKSIRDLFFKNKHLLDWEKYAKFNIHEYFIFFLCLSCDLSICNNWFDIEKQYDLMRYGDEFHYDVSGNSRDMSVSFFNLGEKSETVFCCCSHDCIAHNCSVLTNPHTNIGIFVACDCLTKVCSDKEIRKKFKKMYEKKKLENPSYVESIKRHESKKEIKKQKELEDQLKKENRQCDSCNNYCIPINEPCWKKKCYSCYTLTGKCFIKKK